MNPPASNAVRLTYILGPDFVRKIGADREVPHGQAVGVALPGKEVIATVAPERLHIVSCDKNKRVDKVLCLSSVIVRSRCGKYRYFLKRQWDNRKEVLLFLAVNPDDATTQKNGRETRAFQKWAQIYGYGGFAVVCFFALTRVKPKDLWGMSEQSEQEKLGPHNEAVIREKLREHRKVACVWGQRGAWVGSGRASFLEKAIKEEGAEAYRLFKNRGWTPINPVHTQFWE